MGNSRRYIRGQRGLFMAKVGAGMKLFVANRLGGMLLVMAAMQFASSGQAGGVQVAGLSTPGTTSYPDGGLATVSSVRLASENNLLTAMPDFDNGYAYFASNTTPGLFVKVAVGDGDEAPRRIGRLTLDPGEDNVKCGVIDAAHGYAYIATSTIPSSIVKVALGTGDERPTRVGTLMLDAADGAVTSAAIDVQNGYAYFGTGTSPGWLVPLLPVVDQG